MAPKFFSIIPQFYYYGEEYSFELKLQHAKILREVQEFDLKDLLIKVFEQENCVLIFVSVSRKVCLAFLNLALTNGKNQHNFKTEHED